MRRIFQGLFMLVALAAGVASGFQFSNAYYSPRNPEREIRRVTRYIVLHTTEAEAASALRKLSDNGEAHFCVDTDGRVYRIVDHRRVAFHCGRSMWDGRVNIDDCAVGIEVVGFHDRNITPAQYKALSELLAELKFYYKITDERILTHSMVAYGAPNRWFARSHRGRKRCGMLFALPSVRQRLHIMAKPAYDPDVRAGRLVNGDAYLAQVLYGGGGGAVAAAASAPRAAPANVVSRSLSVWDIARDAYDDASTIYIWPNGTRRNGRQIRDWRAVPYGVKVLVAGEPHHVIEGVKTIGVDGASAREIAGDEAGSGTTIYIFRDGHFKRGCDLSTALRAKLPAGTRMLVGFAAGGPITASKRPYQICGARWRLPDTFFLLPSGVIKTGGEVKDAKIPSGTMIFFRS
jgi:hypothetical protein